MYGPTADKMDLVATGSNNNYTVFNIKSPSLHFVVLTDLTPSAFVWYKVGSPVYGWSIAYNFTVKPAAGPTYPLTWLAYGDMGISNSQNTADFTAKLIRSGEASFITHAGDISYADNRASINNGSIYEGVLNDFYNEVQPSSAYGAYMTSSGNHEAIVDFLVYRMRNSPTMPQNGGLFWHSYNVGPVHFLAFDIDQSWAVGSAQHAFITADLAAVDRSVTPWTVAYNHFPMLCSNLFWCPGSASFQVRRALSSVARGARANSDTLFDPLTVRPPPLPRPRLPPASSSPQALYEPIFNAPATKVDLFYAGHVHAAEVQWPQVGGVVQQENFENVKATLQVMVGFPGDIEVCCNDWIKPKPAYSFWREDDVAGDGGLFGFSEFHIANATHLRMRMYDSGNQTIVLEQWASRAV
jgi:hypothetical protein